VYRVTCKQCGASGIAEDGNRLQQAVSCTCCTQAHDHDGAANGCPEAGAEGERHGGADCTLGDRACVVLTPAAEECPGGHCGPGVDGCTVCRPVTAEFLGIAPLGLAMGA
jgi:hypothetical protein